MIFNSVSPPCPRPNRIGREARQLAEIIGAKSETPLPIHARERAGVSFLGTPVAKQTERATRSGWRSTSAKNNFDEISEFLDHLEPTAHADVVELPTAGQGGKGHRSLARRCLYGGGSGY